MHIITVSSFKGGTAKTSTVLHVGAACAKYHKKKVLLVDFDAQANLTLGLGYDPDSQDSLAPVLQGMKPVQDVIVPTCIPHLDLIPADPWLERVEVTGALASDRYSHERLKSILTPLEYDLIVIDTPPSLSWLTESALIAATSVMVAVTAEFYSVKGLERLGEFIRTIGKRHPLTILGIVLSFWNPRGKSNEAFMKVIENTFPESCFASKIRRDIAVSEAAVHGKPIFEIPRLSSQSRASEDFQQLAHEVIKKIHENT